MKKIVQRRKFQKNMAYPVVISDKFIEKSNKNRPAKELHSSS